MKSKAGTLVGLGVLCSALAFSPPAAASSIVFSNLGVTNQMAAASRTESGGAMEIELPMISFSTALSQLLPPASSALCLLDSTSTT